jgi:hypothetical protein
MSKAAENTVYLNIGQVATGFLSLLLLLLTVHYARKAANAAIEAAKHGRTAAIAGIHAARAARKSAETIPRIERAYVFMYADLQPKITRTVGRETRKEFHRVTAGFILRNYGKTPAIVKLVNFRLFLMRTGEDIPDYGSPINSFEFVIPDGGIYPSRRGRDEDAIKLFEKYESITYYEYNTITIEIDESQSAKMTEAELFPVVLGRVIYDDIFEGSYDIGVCFIYNGRSETYDQYGGDKYNYRKQLS